MDFGTTVRVYSEGDLQQIQKNPDLLFQDKLGKNPDERAIIPGLHFPKGASLFFASTQPKKFYEIAEILRYSQADVKLYDAINLLHWFHSADEVSQTYVGNAYEKAESLLERIYDDLGYEEVSARLKELGMDLNDVVFAVNDTGCGFNQDYSGESEFQECLHEKGLGAWPGVELGPVTDAQGGIKGFYSSLHEMKKRMVEEGKDPDLTGTDDNVYLFFKLTPERKDIQITSFYSQVPIVHTTEPKPEKENNGGVLTSYDFLKSSDSSLSDKERGSRISELPHYVGVHSAQAQGFKTFLEHIGVGRTAVHAFRQVTERRGPIIASTHHNALPANKVKKWLPEAIHRATDIVADGARVNTIENGAYQELTRDSDVVILGEHDQNIVDNYDEYFLDLFDMWCSLHVDKQLRVETFENTPFFVLNRDNPFVFGDESEDIDWNSPVVEKKFVEFLKSLDSKDDPWQAFILFNQYLHEKGFIKQEPRFLHTRLAPDDPKLVQKVRDALSDVKGKKTHIPDYKDEAFGKDRTDLFEVSVLGSAGTRVKEYCDDGDALGYWAAENGWHIRTGGGRYGIMGAVSNGALRNMEEKGEESSAHLSAIQMPRTIQFEGAVIKQRDAEQSNNKLLQIKDSFDSRMKSIFRSDVNIAMAPGIGTYQELARWIRLREAGYEPFQNKKMIIFNSKQPNGNGEHIRLFDPFLAMMPKDLLKKHLTICDTLDEVKEVTLDAHHQWRQERTYTAAPTLGGPLSSGPR